MDTVEFKKPGISLHFCAEEGKGFLIWKSRREEQQIPTGHEHKILLGRLGFEQNSGRPSLVQHGLVEGSRSTVPGKILVLIIFSKLEHHAQP